MSKKAKIEIGIVILGFIGGAGILAGAWYALTFIPVEWLALVALVAMILIPGALWGGFVLGKTEQRGWLKGVDNALEKAFKASDMATERVKTAKEQQQPNGGGVVFLPMPQISNRASNENEIIDL